jgi:hypothetical protein
MVYGEAEHIDDVGAILDLYPTIPPPVLIESFHVGCFICQPTVFFRRTLYVLLGDLDESLKTAFDFELWLRVFRYAPERVGYIPEFQARSRIHPGTITANFRRTVAIEAINILHRHTGSAQGHWILTYLREYIARAEEPTASAVEAEFTAILREIKSCIPADELGKLELEVTSTLLPLCRSGNPGSGTGD